MVNMVEIWKPVVGWEVLYEVSNLGRIRRTDTQTIRRLRDDSDGYQIIDFERDGNRFCRKVHHVVLEAFSGSRSDGQECRHLNGIRDDNRIDNLRWGSRKENVADSIAHGTFKRGSNHANSKLTEAQVKEIRHLYSRLDVSQYELAKNYGVCQMTISHITNDKTWAHVDKVGSWSDLFTAPELAAAMQVHAAKIAKGDGNYGRANDLRCAAECISDQHEQLEQARETVGRLVGQVRDLMLMVNLLKQEVEKLT